MSPKKPSLQQHAKQSHSVNVDEIYYCDFIDQQVKQNQITPFSCFNPQNSSNHHKNSLKELNSNQQNQRINTSIDKSNIETGQIKLYKERAQTLENRLKQKSHLLKLKQEEINRLNTINQELQQFKSRLLFQSSQKSTHLVTKYTLELHHKQVQTDSIQKLIHTYPTSQFTTSEQSIQLQFQLEKYKKKYTIIEQNLKKRVNQYENQISSLHQKLKHEKNHSNNLQQQIFSLQQENINLKQKLQEAFQQIESFQLQREEITQGMPPAFNSKIMQNHGRKFSFGDDLKQVIIPDFIKQQKNVFLSIFNEVSISFVPEINQKQKWFKSQDPKKKTSYMIRIYPRLYQVKILGNMESKKLSQCKELKRHKLVQNGCNTVQKRLCMAACVNIKLSIGQNSKPKQRKNLRICSKEVAFNSIIFSMHKVLGRKIPQSTIRPESYEPVLLVKEASLNYKINGMNNLQRYQRGEFNNLYQKVDFQKQKKTTTQGSQLSLQRVQNATKNRSQKIYKNLNQTRLQTACLSQNKDIVQRINHHLKNSNLMSPKIQTSDCISSRHQSIQPQFTKSRPKINQTLQSQTQPEYGRPRSTIPIKNHPNVHTIPQNTYSDWIVDQIQQQADKILQKYTPLNVNEITYHQSYPCTYHTQTNIQEFHDKIIKRSHSIQNICQPLRKSLTRQNDKDLVRNMSLTSLQNIKFKQSLPKNNTLRLNSTLQAKPSLQLSKTHEIKDSRIAVPITPLRQNSHKINPSISMKELIAQKCKKLSIN